MANRTKGRVKLPVNPKEMLDLANLVLQKHTADGTTSLLSNLSGSDWSVTGPKIAVAIAKHLEAEDYKRKMEDAYRERDKDMPEVKEILSASAALLKAVYRQNPKKLGDWGFNVDDSPQSKNKNGGNGAI
jgi:hypothetical protein